MNKSIRCRFRLGGMSILKLKLTLCLVLSSCGSKNKGDIIIKSPVLEKISTGDALIEAIETVTSNQNLWTQSRYDTLSTKVNSLYAARIIESADAPLENLFVNSVACLYSRVDKEFKQPQYTNYAQLKSDLNFLESQNNFLYEKGVVGSLLDDKLAKIEDIFSNYENVKSLSESSFGQPPVFMRAYSVEYEPVKKLIVSNKYYSDYFSKNTKIVNSVKEFPSRCSASRKNYYASLEKVIEKKIRNERMNSSDCYQIVAEFQNMAQDYNKSAYDALKDFVDDYIKSLESTDNE